jgi:DNA-binding response OmpR family regulator
LDSYTAGINGREIQMSYKEFEIIKFLIHHKNETVSRDSLLKEIWGENVYTTARTIDNFISRLRHKVEEDPNNPKIILTVHGIGYKLIK